MKDEATGASVNLGVHSINRVWANHTVDWIERLEEILVEKFTHPL